MRIEPRQILAAAAVLLLAGFVHAPAATALETPAAGHDWVVEGGVPEFTLARIWGDPDGRGWVQFGQDFALLGPTAGGGYETTILPDGMHALRVSGEAELWTAFRDVASLGMRGSLRLDNAWQIGWLRLLAGPRLDGAVTLAGLDGAYLAPGATFAVGVELPSASESSLGIWLNSSLGYAIGGRGGGALRGRFWLGVGF